jgi:Arylsulfatase A and related enzymes
MNFVFFFPDEMSASSVSCYGNGVVRMPSFDRLAAAGSRFDSCIVQNPVCSPSRCCLMTGRYVHNDGHRSLWHLLRPHEASLFRYLRDAGYDIKWYGKNDLYSQAYLDELCDDVDEKREGYRRAPRRASANVHAFSLMSKPGDKDYYSFLFAPTPKAEGATPLDPDMARAIDFIEDWKEGDRPFMLFLPLVMPHPPYTAIEPYYSMYSPDQAGRDIARAEDCSGKPSYVELIRRYHRMEGADPALLAKIKAVYYGMNSYVDFMLGELLDALEDKGLFGSTTVVVSSDHGDYAGDYGLVEKWPNAMEDCLVRVPLIIRTPGGVAGHVVREQVEMFDIMPTILELAGIEPGHAHFARSLVPQLGGALGDPERLAFAEGGYDPGDEHCFECLPRGNGLLDERNIYYPKVIQQKERPESVCRSTMVRSRSHKLVMRSSGENELYDLEADPRELVNRYADPVYSKVRSRLESAMLKWYVETADAVPFDENPRGFNPSSPF